MAETNKNSELEELFSLLPVGIIAVGVEGMVTRVNEYAGRVLRCEPESLVGKPYSSLFPAARERQQADSSGCDEIGLKTTVRATNREDDAVTIFLSALQQYDSSGNPAGAIAYVVDTRDIERALRKLTALLIANNTIVQAKNLDEGLVELARVLAIVFPCSFCRILVIDETDNFFVPKATYIFPANNGLLGADRLNNDPTAISDWPGLAERLLDRTPYILTHERHMGSLTRIAERLGLNAEIRFLLAIPLITDKVVGLLHIGSLYEDGLPFTEQRKEESRAIGFQTALLIEGMQAFEITEKENRLLKSLDKGLRHVRPERGVDNVQQTIVNVAADILGLEEAGLYKFRSNSEDLILQAVHGLSIDSIGTTVDASTSTVGQAAITRKPQAAYFDSKAATEDPLYQLFGFRAAVCIPIRESSGDVGAVLFVASRSDKVRFTKTDVEVLTRFATRAGVELQRAPLTGTDDQRLFQLELLKEFNYFAQTRIKRDEIIHAFLTAVTSGKGLALNRAMLFLSNDARNTLTGVMGIGQLTGDQAKEVWANKEINQLDEYADYLDHLRKHGLPPLTPVGETIRSLSIPVHAEGDDVFSQVLSTGKYQLVRHDGVPPSFRASFDIDSELLVVPLLGQRGVIGLIAADNKFTKVKIGVNEIDLSFKFARAAAMAIENIGRLQSSEAAKDRLQVFYNAITDFDKGNSTEELWKNACVDLITLAEADRIVVFLIDEAAIDRAPELWNGRELLVTDPITEGSTFEVDWANMIRKDGVSLEVAKTGKFVKMENQDQLLKKRTNGRLLDIGVKAALCLPLSLPGKRLGVCWALYRDSRRFPNYEIGALQLYVNHAATTYEGQRQLLRLENMRKASDSLTSANNREELLDRVAANARQVFGAEWAIVWSYDADRDEFVIEESSASGFDQGLWAEMRKPGPQESGFARSLLTKEPTVVDLAETLEGTIGSTTMAIVERLEVRGMLGMPLQTGENEKHGVVLAMYKRRRFFSEGDLDTARTYGSFAGLSLRRAKLLDQSEKRRKAAIAVANIMAVGPREDRLLGIARDIKNASNCDAVTLYEFDESSGKLRHPPTMVGVDDEEGAKFLKDVPKDSIVYKILNGDDPLLVIDDVENSEFKDRPFTKREGIRSVLSLALRTEGERVGVLFVNHRKPHHFTEEEKSSIGLLSEQVAKVIHTKLHKQAAGEAEDGETDSSGQWTGYLSVDEVLKRTAEAARRILNADLSNVTLPSANDKLIVVAEDGWKGEIIGLELENETMSQTGYTILTGKVVAVDDYKTETRFTPPQIVFDRGLKSGLSAPMRFDNRTIGAILVHTKTPRRFNKDDEEILSLIASQTAVAMEVERQRKHLKALNKSCTAITASIGSTDSRSILNYITEQAVESLKSIDRPAPIMATIQLYDEKNNALVMHSVYPKTAANDGLEIEGRVKTLDRAKAKEGKIGITGISVLKEREVYLVSDVAKVPEYIQLNERTKSEVAVLLWDLDGEGGLNHDGAPPRGRKRKVLGVLNVESDRLDGFDQNDGETLKALADLASIVIKNQRDYQELNNAKKKLEKSADVVVSHLSSGRASHTIYGDIYAVSNSLETLLKLDGTKEESDRIPPWGVSDVRKFQIELDKIKKEIRKSTENQRWTLVPLNKIILDQLDELPKRPVDPATARIEKGAETNRLVELLEPAIDTFPGTIDLQTAIDSTESVKVKATFEGLEFIIRNVAENAIRAMRRPLGRPRSLQVTSHTDGELVHLQFKDSGPGMTSEIAERLFKEKLVPNADGLGVGAWHSGLLAEAFGGSIEIEANDSTGATIGIWLPDSSSTDELV